MGGDDSKSKSKKGDKKEAKKAKLEKDEVTSSNAPVFYLVRQEQESKDNDTALLKCLAGSIAFGVTLRPAGPSKLRSGLLPPIPSLVSSPALVSPLPDNSVVFGGNAILKALSACQKSHGLLVDEWLEYERTSLRHLSATSAPAAVEKAVTVLVAALEGNGGRFVVGGTLTAADVSLLSTLSAAKWALPAVLASYVAAHQSLLTEAQSLLTRKFTPTPPPALAPLEASLIRAVSSVFAVAIHKTLPVVFEEICGFVPTVQRCSKPKEGDYQCTDAMSLFGKLKQSQSLPASMKSPRDVAQAIKAAIESSDNGIIDSLNIVGGGFLVCRVQATFLQTRLQPLVKEASGKLSWRNFVGTATATDEKKTVVVDFSSPNIAKEMHVGHLRSTIIGESICRGLEFVGCHVERVNHVGDWGTAFGMLIQYLKEEYPHFGTSDAAADAAAADPNISDLTAFYKNAKKRFEESEDFKEASRLNVVALQSGDDYCTRMWTLICDVSRREFQKVYDRLDITVKECGESFYNDKIPAVIAEFEAKNLVTVVEGGAKCVFCPGMPSPLMLQKSDGGYGYDSTDMAGIKYRLHTLGASRVIVVTDFGQSDHFKMCNWAADRVGWVDRQKHQLQHIGFGTVQGEDGKRFKTRSGETVRLVDLLDEAVLRMKESLEERIKEGRAAITMDDLPAVSEAIGYGAVKYFDLRRNPTTNYKFSYDQMLDTRGNTAVYLLYAHARLVSIFTKAKDQHGVHVEDLVQEGKTSLVLGHASERNLALQMMLFVDHLEPFLEDLFPYHVCDYLYNLAIAASEFVTQCKVLGSEEMNSRLLLCRTTTLLMRMCFDLLGIRHVMRI